MAKKSGHSKSFKLVIVAFLGTILFIGFLFVFRSQQTNSNKVFERGRPNGNEINVTPTFVAKMKNLPTPTPIVYKRLKAYGVEITMEQHDKVVIGKRNHITDVPSSAFDKSEWWSDNALYQNQELFIKNPFICQISSYWCGSYIGPEEAVENAKQECLKSGIDYFSQPYDENKEHAGCCRALVTNRWYTLSCANFERKDEKPSSEELIYTYTLLKDSGADCKDYNCPAALETEIMYY